MRRWVGLFRGFAFLFVLTCWPSCEWLDEMHEPDRTITIVSIIGLVIIWGSVLYHKFVQGNSEPEDRGAGNSGNGDTEKGSS